MDRMGHSQIQTTQRYLHSLPNERLLTNACAWGVHNCAYQLAAMAGPLRRRTPLDPAPFHATRPLL